MIPERDEPLRRQLTVWGLWLLAINGMIGAGIFGVPAGLHALAGDFAPWVFLLCALLIAPILLCFAELSSAYRSTGGPILYVGEAFGDHAGFQAGWAFYVARLTAFAANLKLLVVSIGYFVPALDAVHWQWALLALLSVLLVWINVVGAKAALRSLGSLTVLKLLPLLALALYGLMQLPALLPASVQQPPAAAELGAALLLVIYAFVGFESSVVPAGEAHQPQRDLPRALIAALLVAAALYALVQWAAQSLLPALGQTERPLLAAGEAWLGPLGAALVAAGIIASVGGNLLGSMFSTSRISYRLARDGQLPDWFGAVHPRHATPSHSIIAYGLLSFALAASGSFVWLAVLSVLVRLLLYLACIAALPTLRRRPQPPLLRLPGGWAIPLLAVAVCLGLLTQVSLASVLATLGLLAIGSLLRWLARRPIAP